MSDIRITKYIKKDTYQQKKAFYLHFVKNKKIIFAKRFLIMGNEILVDETDKKILKIITRNARIPFKDVAILCGISRTSVHQRVQRMTDIGVIKSSGFQVNPKNLGYQMCVYVGITLERGSMYNNVVSELEKISEIVESQYTLGAYSILIKLYAKDSEHLMDLLNGQIQEIEGVVNTETLISLDQRIKRDVPIEIL